MTPRPTPASEAAPLFAVLPPPLALNAHGATAAHRSVAFGDGLARSYVNRPASFAIQARDGNGDNCHVGGDPFAVKMRGPVNFQASVTDRGDGTYEVTYTAPVTGDYLVHVTRQYQHISGSPFKLSVISGAIDAAKCKLLSGPSGPALTSPYITLVAGGGPGAEEVVAARHVADRSMACDLIDRGDGTYIGGFRATLSGRCVLSVTLDGEPIGPPTSVQVSPGPTHAESCLVIVSKDSLDAHSPNWHAAADAERQANIHPSSAPLVLPSLSLAIGDRAKLFIEARDAFGNPTLKGGDEWIVELRGPAQAESRIFDKGDGTYEVQIWCTAAGNYSAKFSLVHAVEGGVMALPQRPLSLFVAPGPLAEDCVLSWPSTLPPILIAGEQVTLTLRASDPFGNAPSSLGGAQGTLERLRGLTDLDGPAEWLNCSLETRLVTSSVAEIVMRATPTQVGTYAPILSVGGRAFRPPREDFLVVVRHAPPSAERSYARGNGLQGGVVGSVARVQLVVHDAYGNRLRGVLGSVKVEAWRTTQGVAEAIAATAGSADSATVAAAARAGALLLGGGSGWSAADDWGGAMARASQQQEQQQQALVTLAAAACEVEVSEDKASGQIDASFVPKRAGTYAVRVLVAGAEVSGSPFTPLFTSAGLSPSGCHARGEGLRSASAGRGAVVDIYSHDAHGNTLHSGEGAIFTASVSRWSEAEGGIWRVVDCASRCFDRDDGTYRLAYTTFTAGRGQRLSIMCQGVHVRGSPFTLDVAPGGAHAPHCHVVGAGATYAVLGPRLAEFTVYTHDRWRNQCDKGGERVSVRSSGPSHPIVSIVDQQDGTYKVSARYGLSGVYQISVSIVSSQPSSSHGHGYGGSGGAAGGGGSRAVPVAGSPFTVYAGWQLAEQYLVRWCADMPRTLTALAADPTGGRAWAGGSSMLAVASLGSWRHDDEALLAHTMRAWKLHIARVILQRMVAGAVPAGSPREITSHGAPLSRWQMREQQQQKQAEAATKARESRQSRERSQLQRVVFREKGGHAFREAAAAAKGQKSKPHSLRSY